MNRALAPLLLCLLLGLAGCGESLSRTFGITRASPDEFLVTPQAPLSMPPSYMLQPPQPGAPRPQQLGAAASAESALAPQTTFAPPGTMTPGQEALIQAVGPAAPAGIRASVNAQAAADNPPPGWTDKLLFWKLPKEPGITIDAQKEAERLRENAALGQSNQEGTTPIILPKRKTIFGL